jgi:threonine/homoserine/homoserine lactone efflux protein
MIYIIHFFAGFLMAFIGLCPPGMLNMTTLRTSLESGLKPASWFALGAALIVIVHSGIAIVFASYLNDHPFIILRLRYLGVMVFFGLSYFFFRKARQKFQGKGKEQSGNFLLQGISMSSINMLGIPFYLGISTLMENKGWILLEWPFTVMVIIGAFLGAFALFYTYAVLAARIVSKIGFIASNINYILSGLFFILGIALIVNVLT